MIRRATRAHASTSRHDCPLGHVWAAAQAHGSVRHDTILSQTRMGRARVRLGRAVYLATSGLDIKNRMDSKFIAENSSVTLHF